MRLRTLTFASIAVIGMATTLTATPTHAAQQPQHCVINVSHTEARVACYDSFTASIAKATGGRVTDAPDNAQKAANDPRLDDRLNAPVTTLDGGSTPQANVIIEIAYENRDFGGGSLIFSADRACTDTLDDIDFSVPNLNFGFGFGIRSYRNYANCWSKHYEFPFFQGRSAGWDSGGNLPFPAKSVQWS